ncbi:MAG: stage II sporulation protein M, partial [Nanoarchaeota archaeon]
SATLVGGSRLFSYAQVLSCGLMRFTFHGIPEIGAYFVGGLAGGIVSVAVIRHELYSKKFRKIIFDSMDLAVIAVLLLLLAAIIEVFFSPMIC